MSRGRATRPFSRFCIAVVGWILAAPLVAAVAAAQQAPPDPGAYFTSGVAPGTHLRVFINDARQQFRGSDIDMDGTVSQADARIQDETWPKAVWRPVLEELARYDLDFDGIVTRDEILMGVSRRIRRNAYIFPSGDSEESLKQRIEQDVVRLARADRNGDGRIAWDEMLAFARQTPVPPNSVGGSIMSTILAMDEDRDGSVTREEFDGAIERIFRLVDTDRDDVLSKEELDTFRGRK
jgi:Ca2+-binding EF-hand superfamily protein